jgi:hypothetical protein
VTPIITVLCATCNFRMIPVNLLKILDFVSVPVNREM